MGGGDADESVEDFFGNRVAEEVFLQNRIVAAGLLFGELALQRQVIDFAVGGFMGVVVRIQSIKDGFAVFRLGRFGDKACPIGLGDGDFLTIRKGRFGRMAIGDGELAIKVPYAARKGIEVAKQRLFLDGENVAGFEEKLLELERVFLKLGVACQEGIDPFFADGENFGRIEARRRGVLLHRDLDFGQVLGVGDVFFVAVAAHRGEIVAADQQHVGFLVEAKILR